MFRRPPSSFLRKGGPSENGIPGLTGAASVAARSIGGDRREIIEWIYA